MVSLTPTEERKMTNYTQQRFILTDETKTAKDGFTKLFRLKVAVGFTHKLKGEIKKDTLGGWVDTLLLKNGNARISGDAWVSDNACVSGDARVSDDAWVSDDAEVSGKARVFGDARVFGNARVSDDAEVFGDARVFGNARVSGKVKLKTFLCSKFPFQFQWEVEIWHKKEKEFQEEVKKKLAEMEGK
jgi:hypothetical protein